MLKFKSHCPNCGADITVDVLRGRIDAPCGHRLRIRAKRNGWISCIFAFFLVVTLSNYTHSYFVKIPMGGFLELALAMILILAVVSVLYKIFGFDNVYQVVERK